MKEEVLLILWGYCAVHVHGQQLGATACTQEEEISICQTYYPNSYCNLVLLVCECPASYIATDDQLSCKYECGGLDDPSNGTVTTNGTRQGDVAIYTCGSAYKVVGMETRTCVQDTGWDGTKPTCEPDINECDSDPCQNGATCVDEIAAYSCTCVRGYFGDNCEDETNECTLSNIRIYPPILKCLNGGTCVDEIATYSCDCVTGFDGDRCENDINDCAGDPCQNGGTCTDGINDYTCTCVPGYNGNDCGNKFLVRCEYDTDHRGKEWDYSIANRVVNITCDEGFTGHITRKCLSDGQWHLPVYYCVRAAIQNIENAVGALSTDTSPGTFAIVLNDIQNTTTLTANIEDKITNGEMKILTASLNKIANLLPDQLVTETSIVDTFFESVDNLIDDLNADTWLSEPDITSAVQLLSSVDNFAEAICENLLPEKTLGITNDNIALFAQTVSEEPIIYPVDSIDLDWLTKSKIELQPRAFDGVTGPIMTTAVVYRNLSGILPNTFSKISDTVGDRNNSVEKTINGPVLAMTIPSHLPRKLKSPITLTFEHFDSDMTDPSCTFWDYQSDFHGLWSDEGCRVVSSENAVTVCKCSHLTNFAVMMSPIKQADQSSWDLRIISTVCLSISIICLVGTLVLHLIFWKHLRNERTTVMIHLCVALVISYLTFLIGVNRTKRRIICKAIAVFLHYIFLVVFGIMFVQGIQIAKAVIYVFQTKSNYLKILLGTAWGFPALIVGISMMLSQLDGYGNKKLCWLTSDSGLIWSFVGPAIVVTIFNTICLCLVIRAIFRTQVMKIKPVGQKVRTSMRALCVLLPPLGVTWIVGLFYIDGNTDFIQYIFATLNGLQGFFIFLFHCVLNKQTFQRLWRTYNCFEYLRCLSDYLLDALRQPHRCILYQRHIE